MSGELPPKHAWPKEIAEMPPLSVKGRIGRTREAIAAHGADALVVTDLTNIGWCTGFAGSAGTLVITADTSVLVTDSRYREQAPAQLEAAGSESQVRIESARFDAVAGCLGGARRVALEADRIVWADQCRLADALEAELVATTGLVAELRSVKDEAELARMEAAAEITDAALRDCRDQFVPGVSESGLARMLEDEMRAGGAVGPAYDTIVASGPNAALPHARPGSRRFVSGDLVVVDAGAVVDGYRSDMTRTFVVGRPDGQTAEIHSIVTRAQAQGVAAVRPGVEAQEIDRVCRDFIADAGYGDAFVHGTGHGVGLDVHEPPAVRRGSTAILSPGQVVTVEPGIYLPGFGGVRVEDMVVVTADGCRSLTKYPKEAACR